MASLEQVAQRMSKAEAKQFVKSMEDQSLAMAEESGVIEGIDPAEMTPKEVYQTLVRLAEMNRCLARAVATLAREVEGLDRIEFKY